MGWITNFLFKRNSEALQKEISNQVKSIIENDFLPKINSYIMSHYQMKDIQDGQSLQDYIKEQF